MALTTATVSGTFVRPDAGAAAITAYIEAASVGSVLTASGSVILSKVPIKIQSDGSASVNIWQLPQAGIAPSDARWRLVMISGGNTYKKEFNLTGDITWNSLVDVSGTPITSALVTQATQARDAAIAAAAAVAISTWQATTAYVSGQVVQAPDGSQIKSNSSRTSRASFDATEQTFWTSVLAATGTIARAAVDSTAAALVVDDTTPSLFFTAMRKKFGQLSVVDFGADPSGVSDDTAAFVAALTASAVTYGDAGGDHNPILYCPPGVYNVHDVDLTSRKVLIQGDGPQVVKIRYNGAGGAGTTLFKATTNLGGAISHGGFEGLYLDGKSVGAGTPKSESIYIKTGNTGHDLFWFIEHVSIANTTGDGIVLGSAIALNTHINRFRVDGTMGWGIRISRTTGTEHAPITIDHFTVDCGTVGTLKGLLRVDNGQGHYIRISNGRLEGNSSLVDETVGAVTEKSWILNVNTLASSFGAYYWLDNIMGFTQAAATHSVVRDASGTNKILGRADVVNFDNASLFRADGRSAQNVGVITPQDMQTHFFNAP